MALLQAMADRVEHPLALGGEGAHGALGGAGVDGGADLAVEAVEVELERLELERGGVASSRPAWMTISGTSCELVLVAEDRGGVLEVAAQALGGEAGQRRGEEAVEVGLRELLLPQLRQRDAEGEEGALGLLAAVERLAGAVGRARRRAGRLRLGVEVAGRSGRRSRPAPG